MIINQLLPLPISESKETRRGSGLRRMLCLAALLVFFVAEAWSLDEAFSYDLYVGGVKVKTANASNITGDNIKALDSSVNGGKPLIYYLGLENTLYLYNVDIWRTGKNHHAIESDVPGLKIILYGDNRLYAKDASAIRLNADTEIRTVHPNYGDMGTTTIIGGSEDALYAGKDDYDRSPRITIKYADLQLSSKSSAFDAVSGGESKLIIKNSVITALCTENKSGDCYALFDYKSLTIEKSTVVLTGYSQAIKNLTELTLGPGMYMETPSTGFFSSSSKTIIDASSTAAKQVTFKMSTVEINSTTFPDETFRNWVLGLTCGKDGYLTPPEIEEINTISLDKKGIKNLKGIEYFTALTYLSCIGNSLTTLNVSKNTALQTLYCNDNNLTTLNVSNNPALRTLYCFFNNLATLNVTKNTALTKLYCYSNQLTTLDLSSNTALTDLNCDNNKLTTLDVSKNTALTKLYCYSNQLTTLDLSSNTALTKLSCYGNGIRGEGMTTLVNSLPKVTNGELLVYNNETSTGNSMTCAQVRAAKAKKWNVLMYDGKDWIDYVGSDAIPIDATNFPDKKFRNWVLEQDYGKDGYLTDDEIAAVEVIDVNNKDIANLKGIEYFTALLTLKCYNNSLTTLDLSKNKALELLYCNNNQLTSLDVSNNKALKILDCSRNCIRGEGMTTLVNSLPSTTSGTLYFYNNETSTGNSMTCAQVREAKDKKWNVLMYDGNNWIDYIGSDAIPINATNFPDEKFLIWVLKQSYGKDGNLSDDEIANVKEINVSDKDIASLKGIEFFTALTVLKCNSNSLTTLDVSKNTALTTLLCYGNGIRGEGMTTLVNSLPMIPEGESKGELYVLFSETPAGNEITARQVAVAKDKGWRCLDPASGYEYEGLPDGDVNTDGSVDNKDVEDLSDFIMGRLPDADKWFFDANGDGEVNAADIVYVINILNK